MQRIALEDRSGLVEADGQRAQIAAAKLGATLIGLRRAATRS
jgi:hypothetical protein